VGPMLVGRSSDAYQLSHPFRQPLRFIVMSVTVVSLPVSMGFLRDAPYLEPSWVSFHRHDYRHQETA
jgi:hypothetical protein